MERDKRAIEMILSKAKAEYFSRWGWTLICPAGGLDPDLDPEPHHNFARDAWRASVIACSIQRLAFDNAPNERIDTIPPAAGRHPLELGGISGRIP